MTNRQLAQIRRALNRLPKDAVIDAVIDLNLEGEMDGSHEDIADTLRSYMKGESKPYTKADAIEELLEVYANNDYTTNNAYYALVDQLSDYVEEDDFNAAWKKAGLDLPIEESEEN